MNSEHSKNAFYANTIFALARKNNGIAVATLSIRKGAEKGYVTQVLADRIAQGLNKLAKHKEANKLTHGW